MKEYELHDANDQNDEFYGGSSSMMSTCCGSPPWGEIVDDCGICSECKDHAMFEQDTDDE